MTTSDAGALARLQTLPRRSMALLPTPLTPAPRLGAAIGVPDLWIKHDELVGFGFGGNKVRGLELLVGDALRLGADTLVTGAGAQSNHVRATAAAAAAAGLACEVVYWGTEPKARRGNLRLTDLLGAQCRFTGTTDRTSVDRGIDAVVESLTAEGKKPYAIPRGGAAPLGVIAHVLAFSELIEQCNTLGLSPASVVMAIGSGGTLAGWLLGRRLFGADFGIEGVVVSRPADESRARIRALVDSAAEQLNCREQAGLTEKPLDKAEVVLHDGFIGEGYGIPTKEGLAAIRTAARTEGVFLDPTYTGKALAGVASLASNGHLPSGPIVFLHTGGEPALFALDEVTSTVQGTI